MKSPHSNTRPIAGTVEEFERFVEFDTNGGCWLWGGALANGYGIKRWPVGGVKKEVGAHQISWSLFRGGWPEKWVLHKCDMPCCVNPDHLFLGDAKSNAKDRVRKGRNRNWVLTDEQIAAIQASNANRPDLAKTYGVSEQTVRRVKARPEDKPRRKQPTNAKKTQITRLPLRKLNMDAVVFIRGSSLPLNKPCLSGCYP